MAKVYLKDYQAPAYLVESLNLEINLMATGTIVLATMAIRKNGNINDTLELNGENLKLQSIKLNNKELSKEKFTVDEEYLTISNFPEYGQLEIVTEIFPEKNMALSGLYKSNNMYCTQCEAEGFRRITYFLDRPDVMTKYTTKIIADKKQYPVLLANGNLIENGAIDDGRHYAIWEDPFKKPSYLFAMVAGDLVALNDHFLTASGRLVTLKIYIERENIAKTAYAMAALKKAMAWDEKAYGREYDLDIYMIVAVNDFNMGAMENKGLNIFNSKYVLADVNTATDTDFDNIDAVVGHEYFHNWSGNRITCRDWFQLSLKEGFTVFREQSFMQDISAAEIHRIKDVKLLRERQFAESKGPTAHPVLPDSYLEINNFYTVTIYEKGAEIIRMMQLILGADAFRKASDCYFERHDGQAVTIYDFVQVMQDSSGVDLTQFKKWYVEPNTPKLTVAISYNDDIKNNNGANIFVLTVSQDNIKEPLVIPIKIGLLDGETGKDIDIGDDVLILNQQTQKFKFTNINTNKPVLSFLRGFSAPVEVEAFLTTQELIFILQHDSDDFNRWDASRQLFYDIIINNNGEADEGIFTALANVIDNKNINLQLKAEVISLPTINGLLEQMAPKDPDVVYNSKNILKNVLSNKLHKDLLAEYNSHKNINTQDARAYKNSLLILLLSDDHSTLLELAKSQYYSATNMTDRIAVLSILSHLNCDLREELLEHFYAIWQDDFLVLLKWFRLQACSVLPNTLAVVKSLLNHEKFDLHNPNQVYTLVGGFCGANPVKFHALDGSGYDFLSDIVLTIDKFNPQVAARMLEPLTKWQQFEETRQKLMYKAIEKIAVEKTSKDVLEIISKCQKST